MCVIILKKEGAMEEFMYKYILFDLDGTLTDPGLGITNSVMHALKKNGDRSRKQRIII